MMKRFSLLLSFLLTSALILTGCNKNSSGLDADDPVILSMWHVYGEQSDSPMNQLVNEFNETVGLEKGVIINVTSITNSTTVDEQLRDAQNGVVGAGKFPDLFFCHANSASALGADHLLDWNRYFSPQERDSFVPEFLEDGTIDSRLLVLPVSKSTHVLFLNGSQFRRFSSETGIVPEDLATWDGFFRTAEEFHRWSGGTPFCAMDFLLRAMELNAASLETPLEMKDGWYDLSDPVLRDIWNSFSRALVQGHIVVSDLFSNTQIMTGEVEAGLGSSAAILYYNDTVTYSDNTTEPMKLMTLPMPAAQGGTPVATQAGVGLCAAATTPEKAEAASLFAHWLTESDRNLEFVTKAGYMPARNSGYSSLKEYPFPDEGYSNLYSTLNTIRNTYTTLPEPNIPGYYQRAGKLYDALRQHQKDWAQRCKNGTPVDVLMEEAWQVFSSI